ncbi:LysM peptidoglycan-binding domain-containing protein [Polycladomyces sp. WAk]|uniref:LysM peptidoglycan-binding domain-containing protein n=1 Tax=Polycladomyces zharkentensis TaxID=2807616 RepID=A0ABS2WJ53_9BACL|nr:glycosyl hydrolase family 18 protein [Polycladomyces sp. WAk]MBN2909580.1 LysM peptidoglycan-binding domain-containing protein [Polycladomyces sp. WAk]
MMRRVWCRLLVLVVVTAFAVPSAAAQKTDGWAIDVVQLGDTLSVIAKRHGTTWKRLAQLNGLSRPHLTPGQALIVPRSSLPVRSGDTLWELAMRHGMAVSPLGHANDLRAEHSLVSGERIRIPQPARSPIDAGLFFVPSGNDAKDRALLARYRSMVRRVGLFDVRINANGSLQVRSFGPATTLLRKQGQWPYPVVTNLTNKGFDDEHIRHILSDPARRRTLVDSIWHLLKANGFPGVMLDIEGLKPKDRVLYTQFLRDLSAKLRRSGMEIAVSVPPKQRADMPTHAGAYDYRAIGKYANRVFVMAYDWYIPPFTGPGPVAPYPQVMATMAYASKVISLKKLYLGIPMYGYDWNLATGKGRALSQQKALEQAIDHGATIRFDHRSRTPYYQYAVNGQKHVVWFEDARSLASKFALVKRYKWAGMGGWQMNLFFPQGETLFWLVFRPL